MLETLKFLDRSEIWRRMCSHRKDVVSVTVTRVGSSYKLTAYKSVLRCIRMVEYSTVLNEESPVCHHRALIVEVLAVFETVILVNIGVSHLLLAAHLMGFF